MDSKRRASIIKTLLSGKGLEKYSRFDPNYSAENRRWFVSAVVDAVLNDTPSWEEDKVESRARAIISDANFSLQFDRDMEPNIGLEPSVKKLERKELARRVEALYGVIAQKKDLAKDADDSSKPLVQLRRFVARRRYRGVMRMVYQVNPNSLGFMRYPYDCADNVHWRVNIDAQPFWTPLGTGDVPLTLVKIDTDHDNQPDADVDAADAAASIWSRPFPKNESDPTAHEECKSNLLDCATATSCVLIDTLFEAIDPSPFFKSFNKRAPNQLQIVNPHKNQGTHYLWEDESEWRNVFSKDLVLEADFQIGDHVVVQNHGLYPALVPGGLWVAEHSLVTNLGNRNPNSGKGIRFGGHGLDDPFTMPTVYDHLIKELQTQLHRTFKIADLFLRIQRKDPADPSEVPAGNVIVSPNLEVKDPRTQQKIKFDGYTIFFDVTYDNYKKPPKKGRRPTITEGEGDNPLVIFDIKETNEIAIARPTLKNKLVDQMGRMNQATDSIMVFIKRVPGTPAPGENYYARSAWQVPYVDNTTDKVVFHPLFGGPKGSFVQLERKQMPTGVGRYFRNDPDQAGAFITRPKIDITNLYTGYLRSVGAI